jgi:hypothetical protein
LDAGPRIEHDWAALDRLGAAPGGGGGGGGGYGPGRRLRSSASGCKEVLVDVPALVHTTRTTRHMNNLNQTFAKVDLQI